MTTLNQIQQWIDIGKAKFATHMIVVCDTFDYTDYPVYVMDNEDVNEKRNSYHDADCMSKVMEVIDIREECDTELLAEWVMKGGDNHSHMLVVYGKSNKMECPIYVSSRDEVSVQCKNHHYSECGSRVPFIWDFKANAWTDPREFV
jgi:hypothetical protein